MKTSLFLLFAALCAHAEEPALREAAECRARGGLPNVETKARAGGAIRVGYLGGSITAAPGWRPKSLAWFQDRHPSATFSSIDGYCTYHRLARLEIGAGLGGGPHRVEIELLPESPDKATILFEHNRPDRDMNPAKYAPNVWRLSSIMLIGDVVVEGAAK